MPFDENARLDTSQVEDRRGGGGGGRGRGPGMAVGGGGLGLVAILVIAVLLGADPTEVLGNLPQTTQVSTGSEYTTETGANLAEVCKTGADANTRDDCRAVGYINSIQAFWTKEFASAGSRYSVAKTQFFSGATQGACGYASSASGPFYCPPDQKVYVDLSFFEEMRAQFGIKGGPFAQAYVLAHEYGHHVQNLTGALENSQGAGAEGASVRTELQADCFAGVWARNAVATGYLTEVSNQEIKDALEAASAVGDDRIQRQSQGRVNPESWTHGSSEQRERWFKIGLQSGNPDSCDNLRRALAPNRCRS